MKWEKPNFRRPDLFYVKLQKTKSDANPKTWSISNSSFSTFLTGGLAGLLFTGLIIHVLGETGSDLFSIGSGPLNMHQYEFVSVILGATNAQTIARQLGPNYGLAFSLGYGIGMPAIIMSIRPQENAPITWVANFLSVLLCYIIIGVALRKLDSRLGYKDD